MAKDLENNKKNVSDDSNFVDSNNNPTTVNDGAIIV